MNPTTKKIVLVVIAIIAVALFVHYMMYPSLSEAFQEGATATQKSSHATTLSNNATKFAGKIHRSLRVKNKNTNQMRPIHEQINDDVKNLDPDTFSKSIKNGNLQTKSTEYQTFIKKVKAYVPTNNPEPKNPDLRDFPNIRKASENAVEEYAKTMLMVRDAMEQALKKPPVLGPKPPVSGPKPPVSGPSPSTKK